MNECINKRMIGRMENFVMAFPQGGSASTVPDPVRRTMYIISLLIPRNKQP